MTTPEQRIAHLQMIQGVISRVSSDSQNIKTLSVTVAAAVIALAGTSQTYSTSITILSMFIMLLFWWLAANSLLVERSYRYMYDEIRTNNIVSDFSMDWRTYCDRVPSVWSLAFSQSIFPVYLSVLLLLGVVSYLSCQ